MQVVRRCEHDARLLPQELDRVVVPRGRTDRDDDRLPLARVPGGAPARRVRIDHAAIDDDEADVVFVQALDRLLETGSGPDRIPPGQKHRREIVADD